LYNGILGEIVLEEEEEAQSSGHRAQSGKRRWGETEKGREGEWGKVRERPEMKLYEN